MNALWYCSEIGCRHVFNKYLDAPNHDEFFKFHSLKYLLKLGKSDLKKIYQKNRFA